MNSFNWFKAIGYGVLIWGVAAVSLWVLGLTTLSVGWAHGIVALVLGFTAYLFAIDARPADAGRALGYGLVWAAVGMVLDAIITRGFDAHVFATWQYYAGYAMVFLAPMFQLEQPSGRTMST